MAFFLGKAIIFLLIVAALACTGVGAYKLLTKDKETPKEEDIKEGDQSEDDWSSF